MASQQEGQASREDTPAQPPGQPPFKPPGASEDAGCTGQQSGSPSLGHAPGAGPEPARWELAFPLPNGEVTWNVGFSGVMFI